MKQGRLNSLAGAVALGALLLPGLALSLARAQPSPIEASVPSDQLTPYQQALLKFKSGNYDAAHVAIDAAEIAHPGDPATELLKARILTELGDYSEAERALLPLLNSPAANPLPVQLAMGDLLLRKKDDTGAGKYYGEALQAKPNDPDITLKLIYARIGAGDLGAAEKLASQLKPFDPSVDPLDPKHPPNPAYYFAKAALDQATGKIGSADDDIQSVRTLYGNTAANRYLKTYLEVIAAAKTAVPSGTNAPPAPSGR